MLIARPAFAGDDPVPQGYSVSYKINLPRGMQMLLLEDSRIDGRLKGVMWGAGGIDRLDEKDRAFFSDGAPRNATLMTLDSRGNAVYQKQLDCILAKVEKARLVPGRTSYSLTEDKSTGFGSYAGPVTSFFEVVRGKPRWLYAKKEKSGKLVKIFVMRSLKTDWKILPSTEGKGRDIYQVACRPDTRFEGEFMLIYTRYHFNGRSWIRHERRENGFWETENGFPYRTNFP